MEQDMGPEIDPHNKDQLTLTMVQRQFSIKKNAHV
jgi:hypothetical protein